jgi:hypothetical protein
MLTSRGGILAKIETVYGTDPVPVVGTDAVLVEDLAWSHAGARMNPRPALRASLGKLPHVFGGTLLQLSFTCELKGPGSAYSATVRPEIDALLRACAAGATIVTTGGSESATYKPVSSDKESCTIYFYRDGKRQILTGCIGDVEFTNVTGERGLAKFTMTGHVAAETDTALPTFTFDTTVPPTVKGGAFLIGAYAAIVNAVNVKYGNKVSMPPNLSGSDGYGELQVTDRDVTGSFDPEDVLIATYPFLANWKAGTAAALDTGVISGAQYNRYRFQLPVVHARELAPGDRDGITTFEFGFGAAESAGDDEVSLIFT